MNPTLWEKQRQLLSDMRALRGAIEKTSATIADLDVGDASSVVAELDTHADPQAIQDALKAVEQELEQELSNTTEHTPGSNDAVAYSNGTYQQGRRRRPRLRLRRRRRRRRRRCKSSRNRRCRKRQQDRPRGCRNTG